MIFSFMHILTPTGLQARSAVHPTGLQSDATGLLATVKTGPVLASEATLQADSPTTISTSFKDASAAPASVAALGTAETSSVRNEERGLVKKKKKSRSRRALRQPAARASAWQNALRNAQHFAVTGAAAAILSATVGFSQLLSCRYLQFWDLQIHTLNNFALEVLWK